MLQALLLSRDQDVVRIMRRALEAVSIQVNVVTASEQAMEALQRQKFDAVLVDVDDVHEGTSVIPKLRAGKSNQRSIIFAITNGITTVKAAFEMGANFVLDKPVSFERATRSLRAAHGLIMRERRRYFRAAVSISAEISYRDVSSATVAINNISEGGVSLQMDRTTNVVGAVTVRFTLPGAKRAIEVQGEFVSSNRVGNVGVKFVSMSPTAKAELDAWLNRQIEEAAPILNIQTRR